METAQSVEKSVVVFECTFTVTRRHSERWEERAVCAQDTWHASHNSWPLHPTFYPTLCTSTANKASSLIYMSHRVIWPLMLWRGGPHPASWLRLVMIDCQKIKGDNIKRTGIKRNKAVQTVYKQIEDWLTPPFPTITLNNSLVLLCP